VFGGTLLPVIPSFVTIALTHSLLRFQSAVILSASVTFLALPGMTGAARIAGFVAISCAVGSMLASTIAFIRFRNEFSGVIDRTSVNHRLVGGEGLAGISVSIPLPFSYTYTNHPLTIYCAFRTAPLSTPFPLSSLPTPLSGSSSV
jgi:hypothetical protein